MINDVIKAHNRIKLYINKTPVLTSDAINKICGAEIFFKCENFQRTGSFKVRGALNALLSFNEEEIVGGVATHSSGNFASGLAYGAGLLQIKSYVVMPGNSPEIKRRIARNYGAEVIISKESQIEREEALNELIRRMKCIYIPSSNHHEVIAGQGTSALELLRDVKDLDMLLAPVGGGGILSGSAIVASSQEGNVTSVIGMEPVNSDYAYQSLKSGVNIPQNKYFHTIADGLRVSLAELAFPIIRKYVNDIVRVSEDGIKLAMRILWERMKIIIEPSSAVSLAGILENRRLFKGKRIGIIITGGNVSLDGLPF